MTTPKLYNYLDEIDRVAEIGLSSKTKLQYYASDLLQRLHYRDMEELNTSLYRAFEVCRSLHISLSQNFRHTFRYENNEVKSDWQLSALGYYLLILNGNPGNAAVAKAQLLLALKL